MAELTQDQVLQYIQYVLSGDNIKIQEATKAFKVYTKTLASTATLAIIMSQSQNDQHRQLAAVLLKRNMAVKFSQLDNASQTQLQQLLLQRFFSETVNIIRTNIGQLIGTIAQLTLNEGKWPELLQSLQTQTANTQDLQTRQRGLILLSLIFDYSGDSLKPYYKAFYPFFVQNLQDPDKQIRAQTVKCLISLFDNIENMSKEERQQYQSLVEPILVFVDQCIKEGDEDNAYHCFDAFGYLADTKLTMLDVHLGMIIKYAASQNLLLNPQCSNKFKECVIDFIYSCIETHKKILQKDQQLLNQLVECLCLIVAQPLNRDQLESDDEPIQDVTLWLMETLTLSFGKKKPLYNIFLTAVTRLIDSNDVNQMNAGFLILASITEGLQDLVRRNLKNPIMNVLIPKGLSDQRVEVRGAAIKALSYFSEWLAPEILNFDSIIIPEMLKSLSSQNNKVYEKALLTIDIFAENMEREKIQPYLSQLLPSLIQMFLAPNTTFLARRTCSEYFQIYLKEVSELLLKVLAERDTPEILAIKAEAIQVLGIICDTYKDLEEVQTQLVNPLAPQIYNLLIQHQDNEVREGCLSFFYNMASAQGEKFAPIFQQLIDFTLQLAESNEGIINEPGKGGEFSLDSDSEAEDTSGPMRVKVTQMDEKAAAIHALGQFAISVPLSFGPYFKKAFDILDVTIEYFYDNIRIQTIQCYRDLIEAYIKYKNGGQLPKVQYGLPVSLQLDKEFSDLISLIIVQKLIKIVNDDDSMECVALVYDSLADLLRKVGPAIIHQNINDITQVTIQVLEKKIKVLGADLEAEDELDDDMIETIFENVTDFIPAMAKALKQGFLFSFRELLPKLLTYLHKDQDINDIVQVVGCFGQLFENEPTLIQECQTQVIPFLLSATEIGDVELNRNIAFALATFSEFAAQQDVQTILPQIIQTLRHIYANSTNYIEGSENAIAAFCRIIIRFPQVFQNELLDSILMSLPFTGDILENFTAIKMLLFLATNYPQAIQEKMEKIIFLLVNCLAFADTYGIDEEKKLILVTSLKQLIGSQYKAFVEKYVLEIKEDKRKIKVVQELQ
ncbi:hypothetical protein pb186bvf_005558 [Paramecium bursaria]